MLPVWHIDSCHKGASKASAVSYQGRKNTKWGEKNAYLLIKDTPRAAVNQKPRNMRVKEKRKKKKLWKGGHRQRADENCSMGILYVWS